MGSRTKSFLSLVDGKKKKKQCSSTRKNPRSHLQNTMASGSDLPRVIEVSRLITAREPEVRARERGRVTNARCNLSSRRRQRGATALKKTTLSLFNSLPTSSLNRSRPSSPRSSRGRREATEGQQPRAVPPGSRGAARPSRARRGGGRRVTTLQRRRRRRWGSGGGRSSASSARKRRRRGR